MRAYVGCAWIDLTRPFLTPYSPGKDGTHIGDRLFDVGSSRGGCRWIVKSLNESRIS